MTEGIGSPSRGRSYISFVVFTVTYLAGDIDQLELRSIAGGLQQSSSLPSVWFENQCIYRDAYGKCLEERHAMLPTKRSSTSLAHSPSSGVEFLVKSNTCDYLFSSSLVEENDRVCACAMQVQSTASGTTYAST